MTQRTGPGQATVLLSHPSVAAIPSLNLTDPLVELTAAFGPNRARVRSMLAWRLEEAQLLLPAGIHIRVVEGLREAADQQGIIDRYSAEIASLNPHLSVAERHDLTSRFVSPISVAPHVAGAAVDLTLVDADGRELDLGTAIDATPEQSLGACYFDAIAIGAEARSNRDLLADVLLDVGCVNYPTEWWHWSFGDKYWALLTGAPAALFGPVGTTEPA